ncbi:MAG: hypothetical protein MUF23_03755 [Pirellula sp.]|nr:hypothetical protein [Pirellula sp.]
MTPNRVEPNLVVPIIQWPLPWAQIAREWLGDIRLHLPSRFANSVSEDTLPTLLGIVASHRHRTDPLRPTWEASLEAALKYAERGRLMVLFAGGSPYADRLRHACNRFGLDFLELWHEADRRFSDDPTHAARIHVHGNPLPERSIVPEARFEDRAVTILADQLFALQVRRNGKIAQLIEARLAENRVRPGSTIVACDTKSTSDRHHPCEAALSRSGAVLWFTERNQHLLRSIERGRLSNWGCRNRCSPSTRMPSSEITESLMRSKEFLIHCTRSRQSAWPDQSRDHLYDEVIRWEWHDDSTEIDTLLRILVTQRLIASSNLRRGNVSTICFTARSLGETVNQRAFQSHLGRWDWEPYGLAIRKEKLVALGATPVRYLPNKEIESLPARDQAFAQPSPIHPNQVDWSVEEEWRVQGDIRLCQIRSDEAFLFVKSDRDANLVTPWSRWPVYYLCASH